MVWNMKYARFTMKAYTFLVFCIVLGEPSQVMSRDIVANDGGLKWTKKAYVENVPYSLYGQATRGDEGMDARKSNEAISVHPSELDLQSSDTETRNIPVSMYYGPQSDPRGKKDTAIVSYRASAIPWYTYDERPMPFSKKVELETFPGKYNDQILDAKTAGKLNNEQRRTEFFGMGMSPDQGTVEDRLKQKDLVPIPAMLFMSGVNVKTNDTKLADEIAEPKWNPTKKEKKGFHMLSRMQFRHTNVKQKKGKENATKPSIINHHRAVDSIQSDSNNHFMRQRGSVKDSRAPLPVWLQTFKGRFISKEHDVIGSRGGKIPLRMLRFGDGRPNDNAWRNTRRNIPMYFRNKRSTDQNIPYGMYSTAKYNNNELDQDNMEFSRGHQSIMGSNVNVRKDNERTSRKLSAISNGLKKDDGVTKDVNSFTYQGGAFQKLDNSMGHQLESRNMVNDIQKVNREVSGEVSGGKRLDKKA